MLQCEKAAQSRCSTARSGFCNYRKLQNYRVFKASDHSLSNFVISERVNIKEMIARKSCRVVAHYEVSMNVVSVSLPPVTSHMAFIWESNGTFSTKSLSQLPLKRSTIENILWSQRKGSFVRSLPGNNGCIGRVN